MRIAIVGSGYVGLVSGVCFSEMGVEVVCIDNNVDKIESLRNGQVPIYEPELDTLIRKNLSAGRLSFETDLSAVIDTTDIVFIAVGTPSESDGSADSSSVLAVARTFGASISRYTLLVTKSTVPVGTSVRIKTVVNEELKRRGVNIPFDVASNPEFLKEGNAIKDFMSPDRVVVGTESALAKLFFLLGETRDNEEAREMLDCNLRGEISK